MQMAESLPTTVYLLCQLLLYLVGFDTRRVLRACIPSLIIVIVEQCKSTALTLEAVLVLGALYRLFVLRAVAFPRPL